MICVLRFVSVSVSVCVGARLVCLCFCCLWCAFGCWCVVRAFVLCCLCFAFALVVLRV